MTLHRLAAAVLLVAAASAGAAEDNVQQRPRDAAEAVREGDVSQWLKYYQHERAPEPVRAPADTRQPPADTQGQSAEPKRCPVPYIGA